MRDPWLPLIAILIVLVCVLLGIMGPMPKGVAEWLRDWQTLISAAVATTAAYIAFRNTDRSLAHAERLEKHRRQRKHTATRAVLPFALSQVATYADQTAQALKSLIPKCEGEVLPSDILKDDFVKPLPSDTLKSLTDFIEYSDSVNVNIIASTVALIQIHESRLHGMVRDNQDPSKSRMVLQTHLEQSILDAAAIYAGASSGFNYARRWDNHLPGELELSWNDVSRALQNMGFWGTAHPRLFDALKRTAALSRGPFQRNSELRLFSSQ